jgi:tetratricopeptide (TPR) repeat protein
LPAAPQSHLILARTLFALGKPAEAVREYREALRLDPGSQEGLARLSWLLATSAQVRNGAEAVQLAERARDLSHRKNTVILCSLAAAYAADNKFTDAVAAALEALDLARRAGQEGLVNTIGQQLKTYRSGHALSESVQGESSPK